MKIFFCVFILLFTSMLAMGSPIGSTQKMDLSDITQQSITQHVPIVLIFTAPSCQYCKILKSEVIEPMKLEHKKNKPIYVYVDSDANAVLKDFDGKEVSYTVFAHSYHVRGTPTIVITDSGGHPLVEKLVGLSLIDFYTDKLERLIKKAFHNLGKFT